MYCNKSQVNMLTALLVAHDVKHAVVCPGSRNAPIVHNLDACPDMACFPVTDERSAGFYALGIALAVEAPVAVCVTSGSALLNLMPAVAEAFYQRLPLVVISADRPAAWVDQLDGQTLPQSDALGHFVKKAVQLPEGEDSTTQWYCNRLINETLSATTMRDSGPVHINVPLSEPLYEFTLPVLPETRIIRRMELAENRESVPSLLLQHYRQATHPLIVLGQILKHAVDTVVMERLREEAVVWQEPLSGGTHQYLQETLVWFNQHPELAPDFILYVGGTLVSKSAREYLRKVADAKVWLVSERGDISDVTQHAGYVVAASPRTVLNALTTEVATDRKTFIHQWKHARQEAHLRAVAFEPAYSQLCAVKLFEEALLRAEPNDSLVHYANSSAVRVGNIYANNYIYVNRGVNGIEGSMSTAAGMSVVSQQHVYLVIGDLSFFYDVNALWNQNLGGNLRILLLNNGGGGIFCNFQGLRQSHARELLVMAGHDTSAAGVCRSFGANYLVAHNLEELNNGCLDVLVGMETDRPVVLEVFTNAETDNNVLQAYNQLKKI